MEHYCIIRYKFSSLQFHLNGLKRWSGPGLVWRRHHQGDTDTEPRSAEDLSGFRKSLRPWWTF